jgi:hypothetical protein
MINRFASGSYSRTKLVYLMAFLVSPKHLVKIKVKTSATPYCNFAGESKTRHLNLQPFAMININMVILMSEVEAVAPPPVKDQ